MLKSGNLVQDARSDLLRMREKAKLCPEALGRPYRAFRSKRDKETGKVSTGLYGPLQGLYGASWSRFGIWRKQISLVERETRQMSECVRPCWTKRKIQKRPSVLSFLRQHTLVATTRLRLGRDPSQLVRGNPLQTPQKPPGRLQNLPSPALGRAMSVRFCPLPSASGVGRQHLSLPCELPGRGCAWRRSGS